MTDLIERLSDEADLCRNEGADDIARLLDEARAALEAAQRDAGRLDWLQAQDSIDIEQVQRECPEDADLWMVSGHSPEGAEHKVLGHGPSLRAAIDAAIESAKEG
jgi:hypothetical protein